MHAPDRYVRLDRPGEISRRSFLAAGAAATTGLGFAHAMKARADDLRKRGMACILLFMQGGPSQFETFDPKPGTETGGPTRAIDTAVPGIRVAEHWPRTAGQLKDIALIRSMSGREGNHQRAQYLLH